MQTRSFKPSPKYLYKLLLSFTVVALLIPMGGVLLGWLIGHEEGVAAGAITMTIVVIGDIAWWAPAMILTVPYYRSLSYEIQDDEVIVHVGIVTQSVKHVPYRTVTNITVKRDILDRWLFGLGSLNIQTAGMSGSTGAEEKLVGVTNVQEVYDMVVTELRRFRGGMAATAAEVEPEPALIPSDALTAILAEVRAIRQAVEKQDQRQG
jgi:uncharacterized membrane protein YdbT with pleckstrin-like domain